MEKIKSRSQMKDELKLDLVRKAYDIETIDMVCTVNRYLERHREDLLEYVLDNVYIDVNIIPCSDLRNDAICNNIIVSFIDNDMENIANEFIGLGYDDGEDDDENYGNDFIDHHSKFICGAVYEYIASVNEMLVKTLQIRNVGFNYVSRKVLITPMPKERISYYKTLLENIILDTCSPLDIEEIIHAIFG